MSTLWQMDERTVRLLSVQFDSITADGVFFGINV